MSTYVYFEKCGEDQVVNWLSGVYKALGLIQHQMGVVEDACYPSSQELGTGGPEVLVNLQLYIKAETSLENMRKCFS